MNASQDPQRRKDAMHKLNEWLTHEHKVGYDTGYRAGVEAMRDAILNDKTETRYFFREWVRSQAKELLTEQEEKG